MIRTIPLAVVTLAAVAACGGSASSASPEQAADTDVCAYFAPSAYGMGSNAGALQVNGSIFSGRDEANASPDLWSLVATWRYDAQRYGSYLDPQMEQLALNDLAAIRAWCTAHGYSS